MRPDIRALCRRKLQRGERDIGKPANVRADIQRKGNPEKAAAEQKHPIAEGVQSRKGDVPRADHQRHQINGERLHDRHGEQEHHRRAVHREDLIVLVGGEKRLLRPGQLNAHQDREEAAEEQEYERRDDVAAADHLVVDRRQRAHPAGRRAPHFLQLCGKSKAVQDVVPQLIWFSGDAHLSCSR
ncbi:hypothetical protein ACVWZ6_007462 [Bradyrhizobium sp. GM6.1]